MANPGTPAQSTPGGRVSASRTHAPPRTRPAPLSTRNVQPSLLVRAIHGAPAFLSTFIRREGELAEVRHLLITSRLVTLTGVGGVGKTRLALEAAVALVHDFSDGVWFVDLAPLTDATLLARSLVLALDLREQPGRAPLDTLAELLARQHRLIILDNCEHLIDACAAVTEKLLHAAPGVQVLATSREPLGIAGEAARRVPSLTLPNTHTPMSLEQVVQTESVRLFADRARAIQPAFELSATTVSAVVEVCQNLDGIPLAIELAAARSNVLSVDQIAARLADRFHLLTSAIRTAPKRQQTLRATLDWSYGLLSPEERLLFDRLAVFAGDCALEAVEAVCGGHGVRAEAVVDLLAHLVDKSLVLTELRETMRYKLLETMRQYGREHLLADRADQAVCTRHAEFYVGLVEREAADYHGPSETAALTRLERDYENVRAALDWLISTGQADRAQRMAAGLWWFWVGQQQWEEGRAFLERVVAMPPVRPATRPLLEVLYAAGTMAWRQGDYAIANLRLQATLATAREASCEVVVAWVLVTQAQLAIVRDDSMAARQLALESLAITRSAADRWCEGRALETLSELAMRDGDYATARQLLDEAISLARSTGDRWSLMRSLLVLGDVARSQGDHRRAAEVYTECLEVSRHMYRTPLPGGYESLLHNLAYIALREGDADRAQALFRQSLTLFQRLGDRRGIAECLIGFANVTAAKGRQRMWAVRLFAAADAVLARLNAHMSPSNRADYERSLKGLRTRLGRTAFEAAWNSGRSLSLDEAVAVVAASADPLGEPAILAVTKPQQRVDPLTARECEVAQLVARGFTNRQIADQLVIAEATAERHLANIREKLGFTGRAQIAAWAVESHLVPPGSAPL